MSLDSVAVMDPLLAARQASNAAASSSQGNTQYTDFNGSLPVFSGINAGYTQASHMPADFEHALNRAHEHYRAGDYHKALQLCHSVSTSALLHKCHRLDSHWSETQKGILKFSSKIANHKIATRQSLHCVR